MDYRLQQLSPSESKVNPSLHIIAELSKSMECNSKISSIIPLSYEERSNKFDHRSKGTKSMIYFPFSFLRRLVSIGNSSSQSCSSWTYNYKVEVLFHWNIKPYYHFYIKMLDDGAQNTFLMQSFNVQLKGFSQSLCDFHWCSNRKRNCWENEQRSWFMKRRKENVLNLVDQKKRTLLAEQSGISFSRALG